MTITRIVQALLVAGTLSTAAYAVSTAVLDWQDRRHR